MKYVLLSLIAFLVGVELGKKAIVKAIKQAIDEHERKEA